MKIVCDTNVWLSALTSNQGASYRLVRWLFEQPQNLHCVSTAFVLELEDVFLRPQNRQRMPQFSEEALISFLDDICHTSHPQSIYFLWRPQIKDPKDDMVLELVANAQADVLITFNQKDFQAAAEKFQFELLSPYEFLQKQGVLQ